MDKRSHYKKQKKHVRKAGKRRKVVFNDSAVQHAFLSRDISPDLNPLANNQDPELKAVFSKGGLVLGKEYSQGTPLYDKLLNEVLLKKITNSLLLESTKDIMTFSYEAKDRGMGISTDQMTDLISVMETNPSNRPKDKKLMMIKRLVEINNNQRKIQDGYLNLDIHSNELAKIKTEQERIIGLIREIQRVNTESELIEASSLNRNLNRKLLSLKKKKLVRKLEALPDRMDEVLKEYDSMIAIKAKIPKNEFSGEITDLNYWLNDEAKIDLLDKVIDSVEDKQKKTLMNLKDNDIVKLTKNVDFQSTLQRNNNSMLEQIVSIDQYLTAFLEEQSNPKYVDLELKEIPALSLIDETDKNRYLDALSALKTKIALVASKSLQASHEKDFEIEDKDKGELAEALLTQNIKIAKHGRRSHKRITIDEKGNYKVKAINNNSGVILSYNSNSDLLFSKDKSFFDRAAVAESLKENKSSLFKLDRLINSIVKSGVVRKYVDFADFPSGRVLTIEEMAALKALIRHLEANGYSRDMIIDYISGSIELDFIHENFDVAMNLLNDLRNMYKILSEESILLAKESIAEDDQTIKLYDSEEWDTYFGKKDTIKQMKKLYDFRTLVNHKTPYLDIVAYGEALGIFTVIDTDPDGTPIRVYSVLDNGILDRNQSLNDENEIITKKDYLDRIYSALGVIKIQDMNVQQEDIDLYQERAVNYQISNWSDENVILQSKFFKIPLGNNTKEAKKRKEALSQLDERELKEIVLNNRILYTGLKEMGVNPEGDATDLFAGVSEMFRQISLGNQTEKLLVEFDEARRKGNNQVAFKAAEGIRNNASRIDRTTPVLLKLNALEFLKEYLNYRGKDLQNRKIVVKRGSEKFEYFVRISPKPPSPKDKTTEKFSTLEKIEDYLNAFMPEKFLKEWNANEDLKRFKKYNPRGPKPAQLSRAKHLTQFYAEAAHDLIALLESEKITLPRNAATRKTIQLELLKELYKNKMNVQERDAYNPYNIFKALETEEKLQLGDEEVKKAIAEDVFKINELKYGFNTDLFMPNLDVRSGVKLGDSPVMVSKDLKHLITGFDKNRKKSEVKSKAKIKIPTKAKPSSIVEPTKGVGSKHKSFITVSNRFTTRLTKSGNVISRDTPRISTPTPSEKKLIKSLDATVNEIKGSNKGIKTLMREENKQEVKLLIEEVGKADKSLKSQLNQIKDILPQKTFGTDDFNKLSNKESQIIFTREEMKIRGATEDSINEYYSNYTNIKQRDLYQLMSNILKERASLAILSENVIV